MSTSQATKHTNIHTNIHTYIPTYIHTYIHTYTIEKIEKTKKMLNVSTNMSVKKGGLNLLTCCVMSDMQKVLNSYLNACRGYILDQPIQQLQPALKDELTLYM